jgi:hypothetical protein
LLKNIGFVLFFIVLPGLVSAQGGVKLQPAQELVKLKNVDGVLSWDLDKEIRVIFVPTCQILTEQSSHYYSMGWIDSFGTTHDKLVNWLDFTDVLENRPVQKVSCESRELRIINNLRENGAFPPSFNNRMEIDGETVHYSGEFSGTPSTQFDEDNYKILYGALALGKSSVTFKVYNANWSTTKRKYQIELVYLERLDAKHTSVIEFDSKTYNENLALSDRNKYSQVYVLAAIVFLLGFLLILFIWVKFLPLVKALLLDLLSHTNRSILKTKSFLVIIFRIIMPTKRSRVTKSKIGTYSVADELDKWIKLRNDGHVSEQEFQDAKKELLKRR